MALKYWADERARVMTAYGVNHPTWGNAEDLEYRWWTTARSLAAIPYGQARDDAISAAADAYGVAIEGVRLTGAANSYVSTPDATLFDFSSQDLEVIVKCSLDDWTPATAMTLVGQWNTSAARSWLLQVQTSGALEFTWSQDGTAVLGPIVSTVGTGFADGAMRWVKVVANRNVAGQYDIRFYTSTDGITFTQLGTTLTGATFTGFNNSSAAVQIGANNGGANNRAVGVFSRVLIKRFITQLVVASPILALAGTTVTDAQSNVWTLQSAATALRGYGPFERECNFWAGYTPTAAA